MKWKCDKRPSTSSNKPPSASIEDAELMAREILQSLPTVMTVLPAIEVEAVLIDLPGVT